MNRSDSINELAQALSKAQAEMKSAVKNRENPFFHSSYADLDAYWDVARGPLAKNNLSVSQLPQWIDGKLFLETILMHSSGQYISGLYPITPKDQNPQSVGSAVSYARRYSFGPLLGIVSADEDDDGNKASRIEMRPNPTLNSNRPPSNEPPPMTEADYMPFEPTPDFEMEGMTKLGANSVPAEFVAPFGKFKGKKLKEIPARDLLSYARYLEDDAKKNNKPLSPPAKSFLQNVELLLRKE